ncbi:MAG: inorganic phosphate transporter [Pirellulales bacterium]
MLRRQHSLDSLAGFGIPVSTHVSCGALFGIGAVTGQARWATIGKILLAWVTTLPLGAGSHWIIRSL